MTHVREGGDQGNPVVNEDSNDTISEEFLNIARGVIQRKKEFDPSLKPMNLEGGPGGSQ